MEALRPMGLANVRFAVALEPAPPGEEGADAVQFLFSANPGQPLAPLAEVASGGEMSRFLLALKTCLAAADPHVTLLFDEIDTGVSGRVSGAMAELLQRLAQDRIPLTVCPLSNLKLCVYPDLASHTLGQLLDAGIAATVNSDDPAYFGGYMNENFTQTFAALPLNAGHAYLLARNSFEASFMDASAKQIFIDKLEESFENFR